MLDLVNDPSWLKYIGDRGVRDRIGACRYIRRTMIDSYSRNGFGLWLVEHKRGGIPVGICGFLNREELDDVDLGFAISCEHRGQGYGYEAAVAVVEHGMKSLGFSRILAVVSPDNGPSLGLLEKLGFTNLREHCRDADSAPLILCSLETGEADITIPADA
jgi:RimJ/RimL family protein N-acetyltransferase